jgi:predicted alpha/beta superfamily hydrolase
VVLLNDADYSFPLVSSLDRQLNNGGHTQDVVLVGIGYSVGDPGGLSRTRDYTPTHSPDEPVGHSAEAKMASGHAEEYLEFIRAEVFPFVESRFHVDLSQAALGGHSFGGLFAVYVLAVAPETFKYYIVSDPSLWYDDRTVIQMVSESRGNDVSEILLVGSNPRPGGPAGPQNMVGNARDLSILLKDRFGDEHVTFLLFDGEVHESVFPIAMTRGLRQFFAK